MNTLWNRLISRNDTKPGQALVEFVMVVPLLVLMLAATFSIGAAMYTGANASSAMKEPTRAAAELADAPNATAKASQMISSYQSGSFGMLGAAVDGSIQVQYAQNVNAIMVGKKAVTYPLFPTFNFSVAEPIKAKLLENNKGPVYSFMPQSLPPVLPADYGFTTTYPDKVQLSATCTVTDYNVFSGVPNTNCVAPGPAPTPYTGAPPDPPVTTAPTAPACTQAACPAQWTAYNDALASYNMYKAPTCTRVPTDTACEAQWQAYDDAWQAYNDAVQGDADATAASAAAQAQYAAAVAAFQQCPIDWGKKLVAAHITNMQAVGGCGTSGGRGNGVTFDSTSRPY